MADTVVDAQTDLLIEGFPRSGNTWSEALFREAGNNELNLAHHAHAAAHVIRALSLNVPAIILFRDPDDAVISLLALYENQLKARGAFLEYIRFYKAILPLRGKGMRIYSFTDVTERPDAVVNDLKNHFGLKLTASDFGTPEGEARVFARMDEKARKRRRNSSDVSRSRPDIDPVGRAERRNLAQAAIEAHNAQSARAEARRVFETITSDLQKSEATK